MSAAKSRPVVLAFHAAGANAHPMLQMSRLNVKADSTRFVVVDPEGMGVGSLK